MIRPKKRKIKRDALLENEKRYVYQLIMGFNEGRLRQALVEMLKLYDFDYKMPWHKFRTWIFWMQEAEDINTVEKRTTEPNV
jgi:hypothetical protein